MPMPPFTTSRQPEELHRRAHVPSAWGCEGTQPVANPPLQTPFSALAPRSETPSRAQRGPIRPLRTVKRAERIVVAGEVFCAA